MDTLQLKKLLKTDKYTKKYFCGILSIDKVPIKKIKRPCCFIINTQDSFMPGEHWFALFIPRIGKIEYFDSYGLKPINTEIYEFIKANGSQYIYNKENIQSDNSINCGKFCIFYLYMRCRNINMNKIIKFFTKNKTHNDLFINSLFKKLKFITIKM